MRGQVGFTVYEHAGRAAARSRVEYHCAMVLVPLILRGPAAQLVANNDALQPAIGNVRRWLLEWFQHKVDVTLYSAPVGYEEVCTWSPSVMREKLDQLAVKKEPTLPLAENFEFHLPQDAPTLSFFVAAVHQPCDWPQLPPEDAQADCALQHRIAGALEVTKGGAIGDDDIQVLVPQFASEAIASGLGAWIERLHREFTVQRWDPQQVSQDLVVLQLELGVDAEKTSPIALRTHQLGLDGLEQVLGQVGAVATGVLAVRH